MTTPSPKKWSCPPKSFSSLSPKILLFSKKLLNDKTFEASFPIKKFIFILVARTLISTLRNIALLTHFLRQRFSNFHTYIKFINFGILQKFLLISWFLPFVSGKCRTNIHLNWYVRLFFFRIF